MGGPGVGPGPAVVSVRRSTVVLVVLALVAVVPAVVVGCHFRGYVAGFMGGVAARPAVHVSLKG